MSIVYRGYLTINKKGKKALEKFYKKHPELKNFIKEATDMFDKELAYEGMK